MSVIPEKLIAYNVYNDAERLIGVDAEVELPAFEAITTTISGAGILGEVDSPNVGNFGSLKLALKFRTVSKEAAKLNEPKNQLVTLRADQGSYDVSEGKIGHSALKVVAKGIPTSFTAGTLKAGDPTGTQTTLEIYYIKITLDNETLLELDKYNYIYVVNGVDYLADVRKNT